MTTSGLWNTQVIKACCFETQELRNSGAFFHSRASYLNIFKVLMPTDAQENCFKRNIKIYIKTAPTCFGVITIIRGRNI
jgi:hypothetical protein